jgi:hypothetical protein
MQERAFSDTAVLAKLDDVLVSSSGEGFTTEASFAALPPAELHADNLKGLGITAKGTQMQLVSLHRDLHAQHAAASPPTPSTGSAPASPAFTPDEVKVLKVELRKLQKAPGRGGGAKGGLKQQQTQCNVVNPRTGQPYRMDELVAVLHRHESMRGQRRRGGSVHSPARGRASGTRRTPSQQRQGGERPGGEGSFVWEKCGTLVRSNYGFSKVTSFVR